MLVLQDLKINWPNSRTVSRTSKRNSMMATNKCYSRASLKREVTGQKVADFLTGVNMGSYRQKTQVVQAVLIIPNHS
jgi:hypothetical protein